MTKVIEINGYRKDMGSGDGQQIAFKLKPDQIEALNELTEQLPSYMNRSDCIRAMVLPYIEALKLAKEGKKWEGALKFGKGLVTLKDLLKEAEYEARQSELDLEQKRQTVMDVPELNL
jgi:hypothetical protein